MSQKIDHGPVDKYVDYLVKHGWNQNSWDKARKLMVYPDGSSARDDDYFKKVTREFENRFGPTEYD